MVFGWIIPCILTLSVAASIAELTSSMPCVSQLLTNNRALSLRKFLFAGRAAGCTTSHHDSLRHAGRRLHAGSLDGRTLPGRSFSCVRPTT